MFLEDLAKNILDAPSASLFAYDMRGMAGNLTISWGVDPEASRLYAAHFASCDPWADAINRKKRLRSGEVDLSESLVSATELMKTEFYSDFGRRFGIVGGLSGIVVVNETALAGLSVYCRNATEPFLDDHARIVRLLMPHLQQALRIHGRLVALEHSRSAFLQVVDRLHCGVILLDDAGHVVQVNKAAETIVAGSDGLTIRGGTLYARTSAETSRLQHLARSAVSVSDESAPSPLGSMSLSRASGKRALLVVAAPIHRATAVFELRPPGRVISTALLVSDPERITAAPAEQLKIAYGLSRAEAKVALALLEGLDVKEIAGRLSLSSHTIRTHLQRIFAKTSTAKQSELVRLLLVTTVVP